MLRSIKKIICFIMIFVLVSLVPAVGYADEAYGFAAEDYTGAAITSMIAITKEYSPKEGEFFCKEVLDSSVQKRLYGTLVSLMSSYPADQLKTELSFSVVFKNVSGYALTLDEISEVISCIFRDHPEFFWFYNIGYGINYDSIKNTSTVTVYIHAGSIYSSDAELVKDAEAFYSVADTIVSDAPDSDVYDIITYLDQWLCYNNKYNSDADLNVFDRKNTAVSALVSGNKAETGPVCQGYSGAFKYLCDRLNVTCITISGNVYNSDGCIGAHAWNAVNINNKWYAIDITWNDSLKNKNHFMVGSDTITMKHYGTSFDEFSENHITDSSDDLLVKYYPELSKVKYTLSEEFSLQLTGEKESLYISDGYLYGLAEKQKAGDVIKYFNNSDNVRVYYDGNDLSSSEYVGTGSLIYVTDSTNYMLDYVEVVVLGDINGDGKVTTTDYMKVKKQFNVGVTLTGAEFKAADVSGNNKIDSTDYMRIRKYFNGKYELYI